MDLTLDRLRSETREKTAKYRCIDAFLHTQVFEDTWNQATDDQKLAISIAIDWANKQELFSIVRGLQSRTLGDLSVAQLRDLAKKRGVLYYSIKNKATLLSDLTKLEEAAYDES